MPQPLSATDEHGLAVGGGQLQLDPAVGPLADGVSRVLQQVDQHLLQLGLVAADHAARPST